MLTLSKALDTLYKVTNHTQHNITRKELPFANMWPRNQTKMMINMLLMKCLKNKICAEENFVMALFTCLKRQQYKF